MQKLCYQFERETEKLLLNSNKRYFNSKITDISNFKITKDRKKQQKD